MAGPFCCLGAGRIRSPEAAQKKPRFKQKQGSKLMKRD
ncbi:hypothetical protein PJE062_4113 [Pseudovibrio sp. JE062]|nr:hypothetical protein PJE062_4113 [Pseudovibrio sp. JE062]